jgi:polysaccharide export outer membrane protein
MTWNELKNNVALLLAFLVLACAVATAQTEEQSNQNQASNSNASAMTSPAAATGDDYVIGPDDMLAVNVWKEPDLTRTVPVRPDGKITLPLVGDIEASGLTSKQLQERIEKGLENYLSKPSVTVIIQEAKSQKFNIMGEVQKPGAYLLTHPMTVLDAIALAGGFREWAKTKSIYVLRAQANGKSERLLFNYKRVIKGESTEQNIQLKARDTVVVP